MGSSIYYPTVETGDPYGAPGFVNNIYAAANWYAAGAYATKTLTKYSGATPSAARAYYSWLALSSANIIPSGVTVTSVTLNFTVYKPSGITLRVHGEGLNPLWAPVHPDDTYQTWSAAETSKAFSFALESQAATDIIAGSYGPGIVARLFNMDADDAANVSLVNLYVTINWTANVPTVTTVQPTSGAAGTTGAGGGVVYAENGATVTARGVCWGTSANPVVGGSHTTDAGTTGQFASALTSLTANTLYHVRAYATNSAGTAYGADMTFTTNHLPVLTTVAITPASITDNTATGGGNISDEGGTGVTVKGLCWGTSASPTTVGASVAVGGTGAFAINLAGLTANTLYYVRAYATSAVGTAYGADVTFTTANVGAALPVVTTDVIDTITDTSADCGGNVVSEGTSAVTARGVCWSATTNPPTVSDSKTTSGTGAGAFDADPTSLTPATLYRVRAYATNTTGTAYGSMYEFTTTAAAPSVTGYAAWDIINVEASAGGTVTDDGGADLTEVGIVIGAGANPTIADDTKVAATLVAVGEDFAAMFTGLTPVTAYHYRAYATNADGLTGYGNDRTLTTTSSPFAYPSVLTLPVSGLSTTTVTLNGKVVGEGRLTVTARGFCYALTQAPDLTDTVVTDAAGGRGRYSEDLSSLTVGATYHVRAYATNSEGTRYGGEVVFTMSDATLPEAATDDMLCPDRYDLMITSEDGESHGFVCDWSKGGAGVQIEEPSSLSNNSVSTKGDYGVRDANDYCRTIQTDWSEGGAQTTYDRDADSENAYFSSSNIDVSTVGMFKLGPETETNADTLVLPVILAALSDGTDPYVFCASSYSPYLRYSTNGETWYDILPTGSGTGPAAAVTALATDGEWLYAVSGGKVFRGVTDGWSTFSSDASNANITAIAFASGVLYATKGTSTSTAQLGTFSTAATPVWSALSPTAGRNINASGVTFGLIPVGNYAYWGITNGMVTKVYKAMLGGGSVSDVLSEVVTFPSGFIGASLCSYVQTVYIGGHFDGSTAQTGVGAIYALINDTPALLTDVGSDRSQDNRVLAISAYERSLFFVSNSHIWRWDLVHGGYSHFAGPLSDEALIYYGGIDWQGQWSGLMEPGADSTEAALETGAAITFGTSTLTTPAAGEAHYGELVFTMSSIGASREYMALADASLGATDQIDDTVGTTVEVVYPLNQGQKKKPYGQFAFGINGSDKCAYVLIQNKVLHHEVTMATGNDRDSGDKMIASCFIPFGWHLLRLTLKNGRCTFYCDGVKMMEGVATKTPDPAKTVWMRTTGLGDAKTFVYYVGMMRWTSDGAYTNDIGNQTSIDGVGLACGRDAVWAACSGVGVVKTDPNAYYIPMPDGPPATLVSSRTSGGMPTVDKHFASLHVELMKPLPTGTDLAISGVVDGRGFIGTLDDVHSTDTAKVYTVDVIGRSLQWAAKLSTEDPDLTPEVGEVAVLFDPMPKVPRVYTYYVRCWDGAEGRTGKPWDEDPSTASDFLENIPATVVVIERPGRLPVVAKVIGLEYVEAPPSGKATGREGLFKLVVRRID